MGLCSLQYLVPRRKDMLYLYGIAVERLIIDISVCPQIEFSGKASFYRFVFKPFLLVFPLHGHFVIKYSGIFVCRRNTYR